MSNDPLLQPFQLKHLTLKNRLMISSHEPSYHEDGLPKDRYRLYHVERAKGGVALTMTAGSAIVSADSPPAFGNLHAYNDEIVPWLKKLADECHGYGCAVMIQLTHLGRRTSFAQADWLPVISSSRIREPAHRSFPKQMEEWDIERVIKDYADAAERMVAANLDGFELECYGHLIDNFWAPVTARRTDDYGGSLENRMRFGMRVLKAIRERIGDKPIVGLRIAADEDWEFGLSRKEGVEICKRFKDSGLIDFLNIIRGHNEHDSPMVDMIPVTGMRSSPHLDFAGEIRAETKFPTFHAARIADVATARHAIAAGKLDMVAMTRAHIAEPHIIKKIMEGREDQIRPCVGATYCLDRIYENASATCIHNPATGREASEPHVVARSESPGKKVVIVGAGPGGLETARVSAARGHEVVVFEAAPKAGGQMRLAANLKRRAEMMSIIEWRLGECERLGVEFRFNHYAEADDVLALNPDIVVIATGGLPQNEAIRFGAEHAKSSWDILSGDVKPAGDALVLDENGSHPALVCTEFLADQGVAVEFVTPERNFAPDAGGTNIVPYMRNFVRRGVKITTMTGVSKLERHNNRIKVKLWSPFTMADCGERIVDLVVVENGTAPLDDLYFELKEGSVNRGEVDYPALIAGRKQALRTNQAGAYQLFRIGDAVASRNIHAAVYDGLRFAKAF
ncbi:MAG: FAD-dependent oxidoreductase [Hyphomicrobiales bacterium]|nr:FAD-dependent oxidoreductase [Hyphomicrobiales bacterium]